MSRSLESLCLHTAMLINMCQQITGAALSAYLPTFTSENGFTGANAQIATLAPYGSAIVVRSSNTCVLDL